MKQIHFEFHFELHLVLSGFSHITFPMVAFHPVAVILPRGAKRLRAV